MSETALLWFRLDLRLADNPALQSALGHGGPVIPVFIWSPEEEGRWQPGSASRWWLHQSLSRLETSLRQRGSRLIIRRGSALVALRALLDETGATAVYWNRRYEPAVVARDRDLESALRQDGRRVESFNGSLLFDPRAVHARRDEPYRVFSPFWKACLALPQPEPPGPEPGEVTGPGSWPATLDLDELGLEPPSGRASGLRSNWDPGEAGAAEQLSRFLEVLEGYSTKRDRPDAVGTSRLSPHLHFGEVSARQIWSAVNRTQQRCPAAMQSFLRELGWREFAHHLLWYFPHTPDRPLRERFAAFPWRSDAASLRCWQRGQTGYPIVDAGMRQLLQAGWMHNRARMIAASFLVKHLLISWREGASWFWDSLVDADLANNTLGWQWTAGCGADAAPYFRIFNPVSQGERFDPDGHYVRRWVPELGALPAAWIHKPWEAPAYVLAAAGVVLGKDYPRPVVTHRDARARALGAFDFVKHQIG